MDLCLEWFCRRQERRGVRPICGLVGVMGNITHVEKRIFKELLTVDVLRGKHSTGVATVDSFKDTLVAKKAYNVIDFLETKASADLLLNASVCLIGHNRFATKGAVNNINAHPFDFSDVVGAHNGTLNQVHRLDNHAYFDVDSENLYHHMNEHGVDDLFEKMYGAWALTWYNKVGETLNFLRNTQRPLCYCYTKDMKTLYWASESWMLHGILMRNNIEYNEVMLSAEDTLYTFDVPDFNRTGIDRLTLPKVKKMKKTPVIKKPFKSLITHKPSPNSRGGGGFANRAEGLSLVDTIQTFCVDRSSMDLNGMLYINCSLVDSDNIKLRLYADQSSPQWKELMDSAHFFNCRIKAYKSYNGEEYLLADLRSILEEEDEYNTAVEVVVDGYNGDRLNYTQFRKATPAGCAWCDDPADFTKPPLFISRDQFICEDCQSLPEVATYIKNGGLH